MEWAARMVKYLDKYRYYLIFLGHGMLLAITMSMIDFNTVFPAMIDQLSDSKIIFGALYSIMLGVPLIFNLLFSHMMRKDRFKVKYLIFGINLRALSFLGMAIFVYYYSVSQPIIMVSSLFFWTFLFSISGGFAGIAYLDIIGKVFSKEERGKLYTYKQFISSSSALVGGFIIKKIFDVQSLTFPNNYSLILLVAFVGLFIAGFLFLFVKEPPSLTQGEGQSLTDFFREIPSILKKDGSFSRFIVVENLSSLSLMILPFYMVFAKESFALDNSYIGKYLLFQISGTILSNFFWGFINRRMGNKMVVQICIFLGAFIPILALLLGHVDAEAYSIIFFLIGFLISGRKIGFEPYLLEISPEESRTTYIGINGTLSLFVIITPLLGGICIEVFHYHITFIIVAIIMLLTSFFFRDKRSINNCSS